jgi:hypothetical protein
MRNRDCNDIAPSAASPGVLATFLDRLNILQRIRRITTLAHQTATTVRTGTTQGHGGRTDGPLKKEAPVGGTGAAGRRRLGCRVRGTSFHTQTFAQCRQRHRLTRPRAFQPCQSPPSRNAGTLRACESLALPTDPSRVALPSDCSMPQARGDFVCTYQFVCKQRFPTRKP